MNFNDAAVMTVFDKVVSYSLSIARFEQVNQHEPKNAPGDGLSSSVWITSITPYARGSGLNSASGVLVLSQRIYTNFRSQPYDMIDPNVTSAAVDIMGALCGDFDLGTDANIRTVDILGISGTPLNAQSGYVEISRQMYRVMTLYIPIIINDMFLLEA